MDFAIDFKGNHGKPLPICRIQRWADRLISLKNNKKVALITSHEWHFWYICKLLQMYMNKKH